MTVKHLFHKVDIILKTEHFSQGMLNIASQIWFFNVSVKRGMLLQQEKKCCFGLSSFCLLAALRRCQDCLHTAHRIMTFASTETESECSMQLLNGCQCVCVRVCV